MDSVLFSRLYAPSVIIAAGSFIPLTALRTFAATRELYKINVSSSVLLIILLFFGYHLVRSSV